MPGMAIRKCPSRYPRPACVRVRGRLTMWKTLTWRPAIGHPWAFDRARHEQMTELRRSGWSRWVGPADMLAAMVHRPLPFAILVAATLLVAVPATAAISDWSNGAKARMRVLAAGVGDDGKL